MYSIGFVIFLLICFIYYQYSQPNPVDKALGEERIAIESAEAAEKEASHNVLEASEAKKIADLAKLRVQNIKEEENILKTAAVRASIAKKEAENALKAAVNKAETLKTPAAEAEVAKIEIVKKDADQAAAVVESEAKKIETKRLEAEVEAEEAEVTKVKAATNAIAAKIKAEKVAEKAIIATVVRSRLEEEDAKTKLKEAVIKAKADERAAIKNNNTLDEQTANAKIMEANKAAIEKESVNASIAEAARIKTEEKAAKAKSAREEQRAKLEEVKTKIEKELEKKAPKLLAIKKIASKARRAGILNNIINKIPALAPKGDSWNIIRLRSADGNNISCGRYASISAAQKACIANKDCAGFHTRRGRTGMLRRKKVFYDTCLKSSIDKLKLDLSRTTYRLNRKNHPSDIISSFGSESDLLYGDYLNPY
jgi:hypothetical protein